MPKTYGSKSDGTPVTDAIVEELTNEAERGYDVDGILRRRRAGARRWAQPPHQ